MRSIDQVKMMRTASCVLAISLALYALNNGIIGISTEDTLSAAPANSSEEELTVSRLRITQPQFKEGCVSLSTDRKALAFQSQRPGGHGAHDVWLSRLENDRWSEPINAGPGVNTILHELDVCLSPDGKAMYFTRSAFGGRSAVDAQKAITNKQTDLYVSYFRNDGWSTAELVPAPVSLSDSSEYRAVLTLDGRRLYFASDRPGGFGGYDLYYSERVGNEWGKPVNLGPKINTAADELDAAIGSDQETLVLPVQGDLFISFKLDNEWTIPVDVGPRINTPGSDGCPWLGYDGHSLYVNSTWEGILAGKADQGGVWVFEYTKGFSRKGGIPLAPFRRAAPRIVK